MNVLVWLVQGALAALFLLHAYLFLRPPTALRAKFARLPLPPIFLGVAEFFGALGLILPTLSGVAPALTPIAALCLAVIMTGAVVHHLRENEFRETPVTALIALLLLFVAVWRWPA